MLLACEDISTHPAGAAHSYPQAVLVTTYPVVAVHDGVNSDTVTAHVFPFTLVTLCVSVRGTFTTI